MSLWQNIKDAAIRKAGLYLEERVRRLETASTTTTTTTTSTSSGSSVSLPLNPYDGGTGLTSYTTGDMLYASSSSALAKLASVATGQVLVSGGAGTAPAWSADPTATSITATTVYVGNSDTRLYRSAADTLATDDTFKVVGTTNRYLSMIGNYNGSVNSPAIFARGDGSSISTHAVQVLLDTTGSPGSFSEYFRFTTTDGLVNLVSSNSVGFKTTNTSFYAGSMGSSTNTAFEVQKSGSTQREFMILGDGKLQWGSGSAVQDTNLYRYAANTLKTDDALMVASTFNCYDSIYATGEFGLSGAVSNISINGTTSSATTVVNLRYSTDTLYRWVINCEGKMQWGPGGSSSVDTNLYRSAADTLKTDDSLIVGTNLIVTGTSGFTGKATFTLPPIMPSYTVATVPSAATYARGWIYVSDETGGAVMAFSDGANWLRVTDRAIVS